VLSVAGLVIIVLLMFTFDSRLREEVQLRLSSPQATLSNAGTSVRNAKEAVSIAMKERSFDGAPVLIFVFGAGALLLFMLRS
jgi:hypothetical protein